jgi:maleylpyruvate isomerase
VAVERVAAAQQRLRETVAGLDDAAMRAPSGLPGWSRGHLVTHIARNAESCCRLLDWARTGVVAEQYPSAEARAADIEAGAGRSAAELAEDLRATDEAFLAAAEALPVDRRDVEVRALAGWTHPAWYTVYRRWREIEVHHVDLDAGYCAADWPGDYLRWELTDSLAALGAAVGASRVTATDLDLDLATGATGPELADAGHRLLAWLTGRPGATGTDLRPPAWPSRYPVSRGAGVGN